MVYPDGVVHVVDTLNLFLKCILFYWCVLFISMLLTEYFRGTLKDGPQLADRAETADHICKYATDWYDPCLQAICTT